MWQNALNKLSRNMSPQVVNVGGLPDLPRTKTEVAGAVKKIMSAAAELTGSPAFHQLLQAVKLCGGMFVGGQQLLTLVSLTSDIASWQARTPANDAPEYGPWRDQPQSASRAAAFTSAILWERYSSARASRGSRRSTLTEPLTPPRAAVALSWTPTPKKDKDDFFQAADDDKVPQCVEDYMKKLSRKGAQKREAELLAEYDDTILELNQQAPIEYKPNGRKQIYIVSTHSLAH